MYARLVRQIANILFAGRSMGKVLRLEQRFDQEELRKNPGRRTRISWFP